MTMLVVYESVFGNTRQIAEAIADGLGADTQAVAVQQAQADESLALLVVGGPTHMHGLTTRRSRQLATEGAREDRQEHHLEALADAEPGLRTWLADLPTGAGRVAAAFDTRAGGPGWLTGAASHGIARRLRLRGYDVIADESFLVAESEGPLAAGELERARAWGTQLAAALPQATSR